MSATQLPVAEPAEVRRAAAELIRADRRSFATAIVLNALAAGSGLLAPFLVGLIVDTVEAGGGVAAVDRLSALLVGCAVLQLVLSRYARYVGYRFGERTSARLREQFVDRLLALPTRTVERVGTGDLAARATTDVARVALILRDAAPDVVFALIQATIITVAVLVLDPLLGLCGIGGLVGIWFALRWYLRRARAAYLAQSAATAQAAEVLAATVVGARTVEALSLQQSRLAACREAVTKARDAQNTTLALRTVLFPAIDMSYAVAAAAVLMLGGLLYNSGSASLGTVVAAVLYLRQLSAPLDIILTWTETLQSSAASFARLAGLAAASQTRRTTVLTPVDERIQLTDVRYAYEPGRDVLSGVTLSIRPGERLAVVGASGAGKTTLGRLLAGIDRPRSGAATVGGAAIADLPPEQLRAHVVLVTQEHHVFLDSIRHNLLIAAPAASDEDLLAALTVVGADWVTELPDGLDTAVGGDRSVDGAQAQQLALARVLLADPHTVILDEATALLDPSTARSTERALAATLAGRTVITIAHRLHTARDADRVAVMEVGRITELGSHAELIARQAGYAALWRSWHGHSHPSTSTGL